MMGPLTILAIVAFVMGFVAISKYRSLMNFFNKVFAYRKEPINQIELKAKIIASSIFVILWGIIGFVLTIS